ncbi:MAG: hypothetical protein K0S65_4196, partial [Labilithrix sp.]|nr:hypothetical protein [Labilithrix sp.]
LRAIVTADCALVPVCGVTAQKLLGPESVLNRAAKGVSTEAAAKAPAAALVSKNRHADAYTELAP